MISDTAFEFPSLIGELAPNSALQNNDNEDLVLIPRRIWPIFFVLDCSGGMSGSRIKALNQAVSNTIMELVEDQDVNPDVDIRVAVLRVRADCRWLSPALTPVCDFFMDDLTAEGVAAFGQSFLELDNQLSRRNMLHLSADIKSPLIIFTTDGMPADPWEKPLETLKQNKWYKKAVKIAIKIGDSVENDYLVKVVETPDCVLTADDPETIIMRFKELSSLMHQMIGRDDIPFPQDNNEDFTDIAEYNPIIFPVQVDNAYGRAKCKLLKFFRKAIADANNIPYEITECHSKNHCNGACPACDKEAKDLSKLLTDKAVAGQAIQMPNMDTSLFDEFLPYNVSEMPDPPENYNAVFLGGWMGPVW